MIKAVVFDLDNTLVDFMRMKHNAVDAAIHAMIDAGLSYSYNEVSDAVGEIYKEKGIEYQRVFDTLLQRCLVGGLQNPGFRCHCLQTGARGGADSFSARTAHSVKTRAHGSQNSVLCRTHHRLKHGCDFAISTCIISLTRWSLSKTTGERKPSPKPFLTVLKKL